MGDVGKRDLEKLPDVRVIEGVVDVATLFPSPNEVLGTENAKLMRDRGLFEAQVRTKLVYTSLLIENGSDEP